jgi:hypothetical protein
MMPLRTRTGAQDRAYRVASERQQNREAREAARKRWEPRFLGPGESVGDGEPLPF